MNKRANVFTKILVLVLLAFAQRAHTQTATIPIPPPANWHLLSPTTTAYQGIALNEAYSLLAKRNSVPVIVAVIDSGIDTLHNDLLQNLWHNPNEIPNNGIDDDKNGYVDDYYGWNFLGGANNENLAQSVPEYYRLYHRFLKKYEEKTFIQIPKNEQYLYQQWLIAKNIVVTNYEAAIADSAFYKMQYRILKQTSSIITSYLKREIFTIVTLDSLNEIQLSSRVTQAVKLWQQIAMDSEYNNIILISEYEKLLNKISEHIHQYTTPPTNYRDSILQNDGYNIATANYGNHNLMTSSGYHGTSVSSIIGAVRNNNLGIDGIATNIKLMMVRAILGSDEYDKDVALAIRYAVNNGAKVINMSFGKSLSPNRQWVDEAMAYALSKDVVLVHAAGNDSENIDSIFNYPNPYTLTGRLLPHFINVGASTANGNKTLVANFSNYGKLMVTLFAPGNNITCGIAYNGVQQASGTSLAAPMVSGVAALLRSYFPKLSATQIVAIIKQSVTKVNRLIILPAYEKQEVPLAQLCQTGGMLNAYNAVQLALKYKYKN